MKYVDFLEVIPQVFALVGPQNPQRQTDQSPQVNHRIPAAVMLAELVNLGMAVVAAGDAVVGAGSLDLLVLEHTVFQALLLESRLEKSAAAAATEIVGPVGLHVDKILLADHGFDHEAQVFSNGIPVAFAHDLAGILDREFDFQVLVPVGVDLEFALTYPFGIILINILDFKVVLEVEFFQSGPD